MHRRRESKGRDCRGGTHPLRLPDTGVGHKGTYFGGDPVRDIGLHCTDVLLGIIHCDKEISGLTVDVIVKLESVEKGR